jgi:hypothetical protein
MALAEHVQQHEIQTRLHALGVTQAQLREAVSKGFDARTRTTPFHPPSSPGFYQWSEIVVALRQIFVPFKWEPNDAGGFSTVVSPDGQIAIAVATGSDRTGRPGLPDPVTKYPRGSMTHHAVEINQQIGLDLQTGDVILPEAPGTVSRITWWLLVDTRHDEVRLELSCPSAIGEDGRIDSWSERILLEPIGVEPTITMLPDEPDAQPIDVPVERL